MVCLDDSELAEQSALLAERLIGTPFDCSSLTLLGGGSMNFVYRGTLATPSPLGTTVIVKHTTDFLAVNQDFKVDKTRCVRTRHSQWLPSPIEADSRGLRLLKQAFSMFSMTRNSHSKHRGCCSLTDMGRRKFTRTLAIRPT